MSKYLINRTSSDESHKSDDARCQTGSLKSVSTLAPRTLSKRLKYLKVQPLLKDHVTCPNRDHERADKFACEVEL